MPEYDISKKYDQAGTVITAFVELPVEKGNEETVIEIHVKGGGGIGY